MKSKIIVTEDNSKTLLIPELNETYHSTKGAITEALHVFIKEGLHYIGKQDISIFEMGFGTGLNALVTLKTSISKSFKVDYYCVEAYPVSVEDAMAMEYLKALKLGELEASFKEMHTAPEKTKIDIHDNFYFTKYLSKIEDTTLSKKFDLIYYDAFGPKVQAELWDTPVLSQMFDILEAGGALVTYCAQGQFKRNLKKVGFEVESIPGPPGKREMTRAVKPF
jgi:tRNA U34 5-methylaminomethyl-2-thiouridine-forming methyltransferase MnmC